MSGRRLLDVLLMGALVVGGGILFAEALAIRPPARLYPMAVLGVTLALCITALVRGLRLVLRGPREEEAGRDPIGILFAGLLLALTYIGGEMAQLSLGLPAAALQLFQGMLLFFLLALDVLTNFRLRLTRTEAA